MWDFEVTEQQVKRERQKARELRQTRWWQNLIQSTLCHYCRKPIAREEVTMDHIVPLSRGGRSTRGNVVPCCKECNNRKKYLTLMEWEDYLSGTLDQRPS